MGANKGKDYSCAELLLLSRAFIAASENSVVGTSQKGETFWVEVEMKYAIFKKEHEVYKRTKAQIEAHNQLVLDKDDPSVEIAAVVLPTHNQSSLQQKWSKYVQPCTVKFIGLTNNHPLKSGEDEEHYHTHMNGLYMAQEKSSFDIYHPSWEYLKDKPKFISLVQDINEMSKQKSSKGTVMILIEGWNTLLVGISQNVQWQRSSFLIK